MICVQKRMRWFERICYFCYGICTYFLHILFCSNSKNGPSLIDSPCRQTKNRASEKSLNKQPKIDCINVYSELFRIQTGKFKKSIVSLSFCESDIKLFEFLCAALFSGAFLCEKEIKNTVARACLSPFQT